jgi:multicomponent Na+:H+ antiporter subunit F
MTLFYQGVSLFLLLNMAVGLVRVVRGPGSIDRMLAALLFATTGVAVLVLLAEAMALAALRDVALVLALLAALTGVAFVQRHREDFAGKREGEP